jgi:hypothetical protein
MGRSHVGNEAHVDLRHRAVWKDGLAPGTGIASDESFDVDRRLRHETHERVVPVLIAYPARNTQRILGGSLVALWYCVLENLPQRRRQRLHLVEETIDRRRMTVRLDEGIERLDEMPRGARAAIPFSLPSLESDFLRPR